MEPNLLGIDRLIEDICNEPVGASIVVLAVVVAEREITEIHCYPDPGHAFWPINISQL